MKKDRAMLSDATQSDRNFTESSEELHAQCLIYAQLNANQR